MVLIACLDDKNGMSFGGRRQSRDRVVCERILSLSKENRVFMKRYSAKLFPTGNAAVCPCEELAFATGTPGYCFVEIDDVDALLASADEVILYRWNRTYPADRYFPTEILQDGWTLICKNDRFG